MIASSPRVWDDVGMARISNEAAQQVESTLERIAFNGRYPDGTFATKSDRMICADVLRYLATIHDRDRFTLAVNRLVRHI